MIRELNFLTLVFEHFYGGIGMNDKLTKKMVKRIFITLLAVVILTVGSSVASLVNISVINGEKYQNLALEQQLYDTLLSAPRGNIYDKNMNLLATSATAWTVYITPNGIFKIDDVNEREVVKNTIADGLSRILDVEREKVYGYTEKNTYYVIVKKQVDKSQADKVREFITENEELELSSYIGPLVNSSIITFTLSFSPLFIFVTGI